MGKIGEKLGDLLIKNTNYSLIVEYNNISNIRKLSVVRKLNDTSDTYDTSDTKAVYSLLNNKPHYADISLLGILKHLYKRGKISRLEYKENIHRIQKNKPLSKAVYIRCYSFLHTLKSHTNKNTIRALNLLSSSENKRFLSLYGYAVLLKKSAFDSMFSLWLNDDYKNLLQAKISDQFAHKLITDNKIGGDTENTPQAE